MTTTREVSGCEVCGQVHDRATHPCRFEKACSCWRGVSCVTAHCDGCDQVEPVERIRVRFEDGTPDMACNYCADCAAIVRSGNAFGISPLTV